MKPAITDENRNLPEQSGNYREISELTVLISEKENEASGLSVEIEDLKIELGIFLGEYSSRVGVLYLELDAIKLQIREYELRKNIAERAEFDESGDDIEDEIAEAFSDEREKIERMKRENSESSKEREKTIEREKKRSHLGDDAVQEVKKLYKTLALKFHPDKAKGDEARLRNQEIMKEINAAYEEDDLESLKKFCRLADREEKIERETPDEKLARLKTEYAERGVF